MLVGERMVSPVIFVKPDTRVQEALQLMKSERIRRAPVVKDGKLVGIVSDKDLLNASPTKATSLSIWEINYLISKITVGEVMTRDVITVTEDTPIEEAARILADAKIGGLPVVRGESVVGIITETDLFRILLEIMGARELGVRVTMMMEDKPGELAKVSKAIAESGGNIIAMGQFLGEDQMTREVMLKIVGLDKNKATSVIEPIVKSIRDIRMCCD